MALFVERARSVAPRLSLEQADEATAIVEICRRLDGIPLAIELAASRLASMTATEVRDRLDQRFRLLVGSRRGFQRHQTLRQTVAWSYDQLDDAEQALLDRCSVFTGGFDLDGACAVAGSNGTGAPDIYAVLDLLDALVRKSLMVADQSGRRTRFSMLETIRQFGDEQLAARGAAADAHAAHARYFRKPRSRHLRALGQPSPTRGLRVVRRRAAQSALRVPMGRGPPRCRLRCRRRHRHLRGIHRPLGRKLRTPRLGRGTHRAREGR